MLINDKTGGKGSEIERSTKPFDQTRGFHQEKTLLLMTSFGQVEELLVKIDLKEIGFTMKRFSILQHFSSNLSITSCHTVSRQASAIHKSCAKASIRVTPMKLDQGCLMQ